MESILAMIVFGVCCVMLFGMFVQVCFLTWAAKQASGWDGLGRILKDLVTKPLAIVVLVFYGGLASGLVYLATRCWPLI